MMKSGFGTATHQGFKTLEGFHPSNKFIKNTLS